jgi:hypothetical protein
MITFVDVVLLTAVATQGAVTSDGKPMFVSLFWVSSSSDSHEWLDYAEDEQLKVRKVLDYY